MARRNKKDRDVTGLVVAITGGARGIGLATARALVRAGAQVAVGDVDSELATKVAHEFGGVGLPLDVTNRESFATFLDRVEDELGPLDVLVNNAGIMPLGALLDEPDDVTRRIVEINLHGVITGVKLAGERLAARGHGQIVNVASAVGRVALPHAATYSATKYAVVGLTEAMRQELRPRGVEVSAVLPMIVNTELGGGLRKVRGQRTVEATEVADAIVGVIRRPRFETWVPMSGYRLMKGMALVPYSWGEAIGRLIGASDVLATPDSDARSEYEKRARG